jgi:hypothetical protein
MKFTLPTPWTDKEFEIANLPNLVYLVGPNGSGKTRFSDVLSTFLTKNRTLSADRLSGLSTKHVSYDNIMGNPMFEAGFNKDQFSSYSTTSKKLGYGFDAFILLEERYDLRIQIEATLSQLLSRDIRMEWDSGRLNPVAYNKISGKSYKLHKDECHGIKELLIILTHLYDDENESLIIDEPELNLHPQYQSFLISEIKKVLGNKRFNKKNIVLITHSPFIIDLKLTEDLKSIISFNSSFDIPTHIADIDDEKLKQFSSLVSNLNVHHKQLFFADSPIFVEGIFDSMFFQALQNKRGVSLEGAGSCLIDVGGNDKIAQYFYLSQSLGKKSYFVYDLDSLFGQKLRKSADSSDLTKEYLSSIGASESFQETCSDFEKSLKTQIDITLKIENIDNTYIDFQKYLANLLASTDKDKWKKMRTAFLIELQSDPGNFEKILPKRTITLLKQKLNNITEALKTNKVFLLQNGALENYLPSYVGNKYRISEDLKRKTVESEIEIIQDLSEEQLESRYSELYTILTKFPSTKKINYIVQIQSYVSDIVYKIQKGISTNSILSKESIPVYLGNEWKSILKIIEIEDLIIKDGKYKCSLNVLDKWDIGEIKISFNKNTNPTKINLNES